MWGLGHVPRWEDDEGAGSAIFSEKVSPQPSCCGEALWGHWSQPSGDPGVLPEGRHPSGEEVCAALCIRDNGEGQVESASQFSLKRWPRERSVHCIPRALAFLPETSELRKSISKASSSLRWLNWPLHGVWPRDDLVYIAWLGGLTLTTILPSCSI